MLSLKVEELDEDEMMITQAVRVRMLKSMAAETEVDGEEEPSA
jgi:hypothetical protein